MKKFLSLLLALTMVLSLTVVPARASETGSMSEGASLSIKKDNSDISSLTIDVSENAVTLTATPSEGAKLKDASGNELTNQPTPSYQWTAPDNSGVQFGTPNAQSTTVSATKATESPITLTCTATWSATVGDAGSTQTYTAKLSDTVSLTVTDNSSALKAAIATVTYNGTNCYDSTNKTVTAYKSTSADNWSATFTQESGFTFKSATYNATNKQLQVVATKDSKDYTTYVSCTLATVSVSASDNCDTISKDGTANLTATATAVAGTTPTYAWTYKVKDAAGEGTSLSSTTATAAFSKNDVSAQTVYTVTCTVTYGEGKTAVGTKDITVENKTYAFAGSTAIYVNKNATKYVDAKLYPVGSSTPADGATYTYTVSPSTPNVVTVVSNGLITVQNSGYANVTVSSNYKGKAYSYNVVIYASALSADLTRQVYYGNPVTYSYSDLIEAANKALSGSYGYGSYYGTDTTIVSASAPVSLSNLGTFTGSISNNSGYIYATASYSGRGKAPITATVKTSTGQPVTVTLNIPVVPIPRTFDSLTAEPVTTNYTTSINNYRITFPSTYSTYYVVQKNGTTAPDYATVSLGNPYSAGSQYTLSSADFGTNGTCTLYVIATNNYTYGSSYGMYYSGAITVSQTNYNINYNGVAGETVQFKHADFTNFMNEVSQARGDASKTGSYPYVTFNYVTFNYPTSTQGTLYYNGTAMSNSSYSGSFNSRTQITNLDNVTFVPYARTSAKSIPLTFTLSVTKYGANGAVVNRDLKYTGTVAVSIVREDIKYTAAPGDTIRFTDSDFLNYLRTQNGFNSNYYSIDYVTFDQSAVNALNEGVLYAYSTGFNAVKTTDKFYYTTTSYNQNALSDVTFRASAYAKTGTTVYIPFTIYARYGTTGTGTRQVSGTVAIKLAQTMNFVDVKPTDYFYDSVKWAVNSNITKGTSATTFSPYKTCTRAEIVTFLWRAAGSKTPTITRNPFTDVAPSMGMDYYYAILWASQNGIAAGTSATTFSPNATCTRAQIVTFLWRYSNKPAGYYSNPFTDVNKAEHAAYYDAILWAVGKGITKGTTATTFSPYGTCTRGEAVTFLYRAVNGK